MAGSPLRNLWDFQGASAALVWKRTFRAMLSDNLLSRAAEMGYYFLFALFPMLVTASSILGLAARQASHIYDSLLHYLALVLPGGAYTMVIQTFNQTAAASTSGKITIGLVAALWSASVGFASIQDGMNTVYKVRESRPYWKARGAAILVTMLLSVLVTLNLAVLLGGDLVARLVYLSIWHHRLALGTAILIHVVQWIVASACLMLQFSTIYYFAPDLKVKLLALGDAGSGDRDLRLGGLLAGTADLSALLQQLHDHVWFAGWGDHSADVVLHYRLDAAAGRGGEQRDPGGGGREEVEGEWGSAVGCGC